MNFSPFRLRIEKDVIVRIHRSLNGKGVIKVALGQEVTPEDLIGSGNISPGFRIMNLANLLSCAPSQVEKYLQRRLGQKIFKGELLAYKSGFLGAKKIVISPADGLVDFINPKTGEVRLTFLPKKMDLPAGVYGIVESIDRENGDVLLRTQVSLIHGLFGSGRVRDGTLHKVCKREELLTKSYITSSLQGQILLGGSLVFKDSLTSAISCGVKGIISGGINASDYKSMAGGRLVFPKKMENDVGISVVVCEGFGSVPIGWDIYQALAEYDNKFILIDGNRGKILLPSFEGKSIIRVRKVRLGPIPPSDEANQVAKLSLGQRVRIIGNSFAGEQGKIISIDESKSILPSKISTYLVTLETKRRKIKVPVANLEIIL